MEWFLNYETLATLMTAIGIITVLTNIIVQVVKKATWDKIPTNLVAMVVAVLLTMAAFFAFAQTQSIKITWYLIVAALVVGFMVAYAAMFGYDKLKEILHYNTRTGEGDSLA